MHFLGRETESRSGLRFRRMFGEEATTGQRMRSYNDFWFEDINFYKKR